MRSHRIGEKVSRKNLAHLAHLAPLAITSCVRRLWITVRDRVRAVAERPPVWLRFWGTVASTWWLVWFALRLRGHDWAQLGVGLLLGFGLTLTGVGLWLGAAVRDLQRQRAEPEQLERGIYGQVFLESDLESWLEADGSLTLVVSQRRLKRMLRRAKRSGGAVELHVPKETEDERQRRVALGQ